MKERQNTAGGIIEVIVTWVMMVVAVEEVLVMGHVTVNTIHLVKLRIYFPDTYFSGQVSTEQVTWRLAQC